jgi:hypothetical protein
MNARPYIFGCLCLVGANGTAAAYDADMASSLLSSMSRSVNSSFDGGGSRSAQLGRDAATGDVTSARSGTTSSHNAAPAQVPAPADGDADLHDGGPGSRSSAPNWQSMLPGSIF